MSHIAKMNNKLNDKLIKHCYKLINFPNYQFVT